MAKQKVVRRVLADGTVKEYRYDRRQRSDPAAPVYVAPFIERPPRRARPNHSSRRMAIIYFIQSASGAIKIGQTLDLEARFTQLQRGHHERLTVLMAALADTTLETRLLWMFRDLCLRGEWHANDHRIHDEIRRLRKELPSVTNRRFAEGAVALQAAAEFLRRGGAENV